MELRLKQYLTCDENRLTLKKSLPYHLHVGGGAKRKIERDARLRGQNRALKRTHQLKHDLLAFGGKILEQSSRFEATRPSRSCLRTTRTWAVKLAPAFSLLVLLITLSGCMSLTTTERTAVVPDLNRKPAVKQERADGTTTGEVSTKGNLVLVEAHKTSLLCRDVTFQPTLNEVTTINELENPSGPWIWGVVGGLAATGGTVVLATPCSFAEGSCSDKDELAGLTVGGAFLGLGAATLTYAIIEASRTIDSTRTSPGKSKKIPTSWKTCGSHPATNQPVVVALPDGTKLFSRIDGSGTAQVDMSNVEPNRNILDSPTAKVMVAGSTIGEADLRRLSVFAEWETTVSDAEAEQRAFVRAERQRLAAERQRLHERIDAGTPLAIRAAKSAIHERLKAPSTASYRLARVMDTRYPRYFVHVVVDAQNSFGARIRESYMVILRIKPGTNLYSIDKQFGLQRATGVTLTKSEIAIMKSMNGW